MVVLIPDQFTRAEEREWVDKMLVRLAQRDGRTASSDRDLMARAERLAARHLPDHAAASHPASVRWVTNQTGRWGSCTPADATIRISNRISDMPDWVVDYVIMHELVHLIVPAHNAEFWALVNRFPKSERARGYLEGVAAASGNDVVED